MNPILAILKSRRLRADSEIEALLLRLSEPLPETWATDWHIGDRVERVRIGLIDNAPVGTRGTIMSIEPIGPQVIHCQPLYVQWSGVMPMGQWMHPGDLKLIRRGPGVCAADALISLSQQTVNDLFTESLHE